MISGAKRAAVYADGALGNRKSQSGATGIF